MRMFQRLRGYSVFVVFGIMMLSSLFCSAQAPTASSLPSEAVKEAHMYRLLFRQSLTYKRLADEADAAGEPKPYFRRLIASRFDLDDYDATSLLRLSIAYQAEIAPVREKIEAVKAAFLAKFPLGFRYPGMDMTQPPELGELQARENAITLRYRDLLRNELSSEVFQKVNNKMHETYANIGGKPQSEQ